MALGAMMEHIEIFKLQLDPAIQPRAIMDMVIIQEYAEEMKAGTQFPPVEVVFDGTQNYYVWDGFHRVNAAKQAGLTTTLANTRRGTKEEAQWLALSANSTHGLRRSNEDKRRAVEMALKHPRSRGLSSNQIARHCGVSHTFVDNTRAILQPLRDNRIVVRNGSTYTMDTANIGKTNGNTPIKTCPICNEMYDGAAFSNCPYCYKQSRGLIGWVDEFQEKVNEETDNRPFNYKRDTKASREQDIYTPQGYDACQTPAYALDPLLPYLRSGWVIWEPAAGDGLIVEALYDAGYSQEQVVSSDLLTGQNFFEHEPVRWDCLLTNPPYSIKYQWLERCYQLGKPFALLLPVETLGAKTAQCLMRQYGFEIMLLDQRINFKMPNKGWDSSAQFPVFWLCWQLLPEPVVFGAINRGDR